MAAQMSFELKAAVLGCLGAAAAAVCSQFYRQQKQEVLFKRLVKAAETAAQKSTYLERTAQNLQHSACSGADNVSAWET